MGADCCVSKPKKVTGNMKSVSNAALQQKVNLASKHKQLNLSDMKIAKFDGSNFTIDKLKSLNASNCGVATFVNMDKIFCGSLNKVNFA